MFGLDLTQYRANRVQQKLAARSYRTLCTNCMQPEFGCYCGQVRRFDPGMHFVILIHPIEARRRIATGRMSHLSLARSSLIRGENYTENPIISSFLSDPGRTCVMLYPGPRSIDIGELSQEAKRDLISNGDIPGREQTALTGAKKELVVFVIDGTWATARKMVRLSENLVHLPRICFKPDRPSRFRVRKQPAPGCFSTIEAIHKTIELLGAECDFDVGNRAHDSLLRTFDFMVERQLGFIKEMKTRASYRFEAQSKAASHATFKVNLQPTAR